MVAKERLFKSLITKIKNGTAKRVNTNVCIFDKAQYKYCRGGLKFIKLPFDGS